MDYFPGTVAHNTAQFGHNDQMPKISRFLYSHWLKTEKNPELQTNSVHDQVSVSYQGRFGERHQRDVQLSENELLVKGHLKSL